MSMQTQQKRAGRRVVQAVILGCCLPMAGGCSNGDPKFQLSDDEVGVVSVTAEDFGASQTALPARGRLALITDESVGRFPAGISVARVEAVMDESDGQRGLRVADMPRDRAVYWSHLLDDMPKVRELRTLRTMGLDPRGSSWRDLLRESVNADCDLCLLYARVLDTDADAEFVGVLWDAENAKLLATFRSPIVLPEDQREAYEKHDHRETERCEAEFRAVRELHRLVRNTVWDLAERDHPLPTTQQSPWKSDVPLYPRDANRDRQLERQLRRLQR